MYISEIYLIRLRINFRNEITADVPYFGFAQFQFLPP